MLVALLCFKIGEKKADREHDCAQVHLRQRSGNTGERTLTKLLSFTSLEQLQSLSGRRQKEEDARERLSGGQRRRGWKGGRVPRRVEGGGGGEAAGARKQVAVLELPEQLFVLHGQTLVDLGLLLQRLLQDRLLAGQLPAGGDTQL